MFYRFSQKDIFQLYCSHATSVGFEPSEWREPLLASFLYMPNVWKIGVISLSDIVKICSSPEIPPAFPDKSSFKVMATVVVMVMTSDGIFLFLSKALIRKSDVINLSYKEKMTWFGGCFYFTVKSNSRENINL